MTIANLKIGTYVVLPEQSLTDDTQSIAPKKPKDMMGTTKKIATAVDRENKPHSKTFSPPSMTAG